MMSGRRRNPIDEQFPEPDGSKAVLLKRIIFAVFALMTALRRRHARLDHLKQARKETAGLALGSKLKTMIR
jgi:hypothetical protein